MRVISPRRRYRDGARVPRKRGPVKVTRADGSVEIVSGDTRTYAQRRDATRSNRRRITHKLKQMVRERDKVCQMCKTAKGPFHVDHIRPYSKGGWQNLANLQLLCVPCNLRKAAGWEPTRSAHEGYGGRA